MTVPRQDLLGSLPVEILIKVFDCLPVASLVFSLGPVNSRLAHIVEEYIRLNVTRCLQGLTLSHARRHQEEEEEEEAERHQSRGSDSFRRRSAGPPTRAAPYTLCFEARRPIDTTATTHELHFDGFEPLSTSKSETGGEDAFKAYSSSVAIQYAKVWNPSEKVQRQCFHLMRTMAVFRFAGPPPPPLPPPVPKIPRQQQSESQTESDDRSLSLNHVIEAGSRTEHTNRPTPAPAPAWQAIRQPFVPTVPTQFAHRMRERDETSSIAPEPPHSFSSASGSVAMTGMMTMMEGEELRSEVDAYDWAPARTVGASSANVLSTSSSSSSRRGGGGSNVSSTASSGIGIQSAEIQNASFEPAYRCQLDPLDSFETFLLSLSLKTTRRARSIVIGSGSGKGDLHSETVRARDSDRSQTRSQPRSAGGWSQLAAQGVGDPEHGRRQERQAVVRQPTRVFERRVASGCDRVMRTWFAPAPARGEDRPDRPNSTTTTPLFSAESSSEEAAITDRRVGSFQVLASTFGTMEMCVPRSQAAQAIKAEAERLQSPPLRQLEIDGSSCTIDVRPQPSVDSIISLHPSLRASAGMASLSSSVSSPRPSSSTSQQRPGGQSGAEDASPAAWLFMSPFAYHNNNNNTSIRSIANTAQTSSVGSAPQYSSGHDLGSRVELKFECTKVRVRAARLLAMLHRLEDEVSEGEQRERVLYFRQHQLTSTP